MPPSIKEIYDWLAPYYDHVWSFKQELVDGLDKFFKERGIHSVLDCACGAGNPIIGLAKKGYEIYGSDFSGVMLRVCEENAKKEGVNIPLLQADWRELREETNERYPGKEFDSIICRGISICHMPTKRDLKLALRNFYNCLKKGGICYIDNKMWIKGIIKSSRPQYNFHPKIIEIGDTKAIFLDVTEYKNGKQIREFFLIKECKGEVTVERRAFDVYPEIFYKSKLKKAMERVGFRVEILTSEDLPFETGSFDKKVKKDIFIGYKDLY